MNAMDQSYEIVGRILVHMASIGMTRIESVSHQNVVEVFGAISDSGRGSVSYQDVLEWMFAEDLLRHSPSGGSARRGVFIFTNVQLTSKGIGLIEAKPGSSKELLQSIKETEASSPKGELSAGVYVKIGSFVGGMLGGFTKSISG